MIVETYRILSFEPRVALEWANGSPCSSGFTNSKQCVLQGILQYAHALEYHRSQDSQCQQSGTSVTFELGAPLLPKVRAVYLDMP